MQTISTEQITTHRDLRPYQSSCVNLTLEAALAPGDRRLYYHLPTGTGKTRVAAALIEQLLKYGRVLFLAHRKELIEQAAASLRMDLPGVSVGVVMAEKNELDAQVLVASVQTLTSGDRMDQVLASAAHGPTLFDARHTRLVAVLIDECHHAVPGSGYETVIQAVHARFPKAAIIGCTATPYRADKAVMQELLPRCTFSRSIKQMQEAQYLSPVTWWPVCIPGLKLDASKTSSTGGERDYQVGMLEREMQPSLPEIVEKTAPLLADRPTVVFAATVKQAKDLAELYSAWQDRRMGNSPLQGLTYPWAAAVWGEMPKQDRADWLKLWKQGKTQIIVNVGILTEGFDYQPISPNQEGLAAMVIARPTMSPGLYLQMLGRGTRLKPGKYQDCLVIDVSGNTNLIESKQLVLPKVLGEPVDEKTYTALLNPEKFAELSLEDANAQPGAASRKKPVILRNTDPISRSWLAWGEQDGCYYADLMSNTYLILQQESASGLYQGTLLTRENFRFTKRETLTQHALPLHELMQHVNLLVANNGLKKVLDKSSAWRSEPASEKALNYLWKLDKIIGTQARNGGWTKNEVAQAITWQIIKGEVSHA